MCLSPAAAYHLTADMSSNLAAIKQLYPESTLCQLNAYRELRLPVPNRRPDL